MDITLDKTGNIQRDGAVAGTWYTHDSDFGATLTGGFESPWFPRKTGLRDWLSRYDPDNPMSVVPAPRKLAQIQFLQVDPNILMDVAHGRVRSAIRAAALTITPGPLLLRADDQSGREMIVHVSSRERLAFRNIPLADILLSEEGGCEALFLALAREIPDFGADSPCTVIRFSTAA